MSYQYNDIWIHSYETLIFVGASVMGDLKNGQYALDGNNGGYYIQPKNIGQYQFIHIGLDFKDSAGNVYDISGMTLVTIVPGNHAYYDEFLTAQGATDLYTPTSPYYLKDTSQLPVGDVVRVLTTKAKYQAHGTVPNNPQPTRIETVEVLPPDRLAQPHNEPHSIAFDAAYSSGQQSSVSSFSWSHYSGSSANLIIVGTGGLQYYTSVPYISSVTYNGLPLTDQRDDSYIVPDDPPDGWLYTVLSSLFYKLNPANNGWYTVQVNYSQSMLVVYGVSCSYSGVNSVTDSNGVANGAGWYTPSVIATTSIAKSWVFNFYFYNNRGIIDYSNNTERWHGLDYQAGASDTGSYVDIGTHNMSWDNTNPTNGRYSSSTISFSPLPIAGNIDISTRFNLIVKNFRDISTRFRLIAKNFRDISTRFGLWGVTTQSATGITFSQMTLNGTIISPDGSNAVIRGFDWGTVPGGPYPNSWTENGSFAAGAYSHTINGLASGQTIYFRAKAVRHY